MDRVRPNVLSAAVLVGTLCAAALAGCASGGGVNGGPARAGTGSTGTASASASASASAKSGQASVAAAAAPAAIPARCAGIMPALQSAFQYDESYAASYNDPTTHQLPHDMATYLKQNIDTYPGLDCAVMGLIESSGPLSAAEIQVRPYDAFWVKELLFSEPTPEEQCTDLHIPGQVRSQGCWSSDGTYIVSLATAKVMVMGTFTLYEANDQAGQLRDAVSRDLSRIAASV